MVLTWRERLRLGLPLPPISGGAEGTIGIDEPVTIDKRLDTETVVQTVSGLTVHREHVVIAGAGAYAEKAGVDATNGLDVDVTRLPALVAGTANIGDVDIASFAAGAITEVQGDVAHDAAAAGNPVLIGARANANEPAVVADADNTHLWADLFGRLVVLPGHPSPEAPVALNATASGDTTVIAAPGAGSLHICKGSVHNRAATNRVVALTDGAAGTVRWRAEVASEGGGSLFDFGARGWKLTATTLLNVNLDAAGDVDVNVTEYYVAP